MLATDELSHGRAHPCWLQRHAPKGRGRVFQREVARFRSHPIKENRASWVGAEIRGAGPVRRHFDRGSRRTAIPWQGRTPRQRALGEFLRNGCRLRDREQACHDCGVPQLQAGCSGDIHFAWGMDIGSRSRSRRITHGMALSLRARMSRPMCGAFLPAIRNGCDSQLQRAMDVAKNAVICYCRRTGYVRHSSPSL